MAPDKSHGDEEARRVTTAARPSDGTVPEAPPAPRAQSRALSMRQKALAAVVGVLSVALIVFSAAWLLPSSAGSEADAPSTLTADGGSTSTDQKAKDDGAGSQKASAESEASNTSGTSDAGAVASDAAAAASTTSDATAGSSEPARAADSTGSAAPPETNEPAAAPNTPQQSTVTVSVSVSSSAVGNPVSGGTTATFEQGATIYDALMSCGLSVNAITSQFGVYVRAIGGLAEKEHDATSGWMYSVNGAVPMVACSAYVLSDGDVVSWYYVTG